MSKTVLVTGGSSGIGLATALGLAARGDHVILWARGERRLKDAAAACLAAGAASAGHAAVDVRDRAAVEEGFAALGASHPGIDAVVHAAGIAAYGRFEEVPPEVFDAVIATNVTGAANVARHAVTTFRRQGHGHLVLVGSILGEIAAPGMSPYAVSKWALRSLARHLRLEQHDRPDVHISLIVPGGVDTPIYQQAATVLGHHGRPPAPVATAEHAGRRIVGILDRPRFHVDIGPLNRAMAAGFTAAPPLFDALVGPLFRRLALDPAAAPNTDGNARSPIG